MQLSDYSNYIYRLNFRLGRSLGRWKTLQESLRIPNSVKEFMELGSKNQN